MDSLELLDFSSFIIFSYDPWSLLVSFRQLFKLPLVVQCCDVICEWPLTVKSEIYILNLVSLLSPLCFIHIYISTKIYLLSIKKISNRNIEHTYLHVHVEGGLAVVLLPPARAPRGSVHAARLHAPSHRDTCPAHTCRDKGTRVSSRLNNRPDNRCPDSLSACHYSLVRSQEHVSCLPVTNLVQRD